MQRYQLKTVTGGLYLFESDTNNMMGLINRANRAFEIKTIDGDRVILIVDNIEYVKAVK